MQLLETLLLITGFFLSHVNGEEGASAEFCNYYERLSWVAQERFFCHMTTPDQLEAINCIKADLSGNNTADKLLSKSYCFRGYHGEQEREDFIVDNQPLREKIDGVCDDQCQAVKKKLLSDLDASEAKMLTASEKAAKSLKATGKAMKALSDGLVQAREQTNAREGIKQKLLTKIENSGLDAETKKRMKASTEESMQFDDPRWTTSYATIIANTNREINTLEKKRIEAESNGKVLKTHFKNTKRYVKGMSNMAKLKKTSEAVNNIASAIPKLTSGEPEKIISGGLDIVKSIAAFLPPPASVLTGSVSGIFNSMFGIGGPSLDQTISDEFKAQTKFLKKEFKALHKKLDEKFDKQLETLQKDRLQAAAIEMKNNQAAFQTLMREQLTFLKPLFDDSIDSDTMLYIGTQINMFEGSVQATKSRLFLEDYCKTEDTDMINICMAIFYQYVTTERMRDIVLAKLISVYRRATIDDRIIQGKLAVKNHRKRNTKMFIEDWMNIPNKDGLYVYGCVSQGEPTLNKSIQAIPKNAVAAIKDYANHLDAVIRPANGENCIGCRTNGGPSKDKPCIFPFKWSEREYEKCVRANDNSVSWCATKVTKDGKMKEYGYCSEICDPEFATEKAKGKEKMKEKTKCTNTAIQAEAEKVNVEGGVGDGRVVERYFKYLGGLPAEETSQCCQECKKKNPATQLFVWTKEYKLCDCLETIPGKNPVTTINHGYVTGVCGKVKEKVKCDNTKNVEQPGGIPVQVQGGVGDGRTIFKNVIRENNFLQNIKESDHCCIECKKKYPGTQLFVFSGWAGFCQCLKAIPGKQPVTRPARGFFTGVCD